MIPVKTLVRIVPAVSRNAVQSRGITKETNVVSVPSTVKISMAVCNLQIYSLIVRKSERVISLSYSVDNYFLFSTVCSMCWNMSCA